MAQMIASMILDGPPVIWQVKDGTDSTGQPFIVAETTDMIIGITARNTRELTYFAASLLSAVRQYTETQKITERDPIA